MSCFRTLVDAPIHIKDDGFATTDESQYKVLREALANTVMHCDHFDSLRSCIRVYTDHIEFMNGGAFPLPVKDILGKIYSKLRNPTIAKLFRFVGIAENAGYGMNKLASWETLTGTRPTIESDRTIATVSFPLKSAIQRKTEDSDVPVSGNDAKNDAKNISQRQRNIIELIQEDPTISLDSIAKAIGVSAPTIDREIVKMSHLIKRIGPKKGGHWEIINN